MKAIDKLGYCPNALARGLVGKKIKAIGVLMPSVSSMVASKILNGIEDAAHNKNYSVIICNTDSNGKRTVNYLRVLREKQIDGIIVVSEILTDEYIDTIKKMEVQVVLVSTIAKGNNFTYIKVDDVKAAYQTTEYLINKGHKNIAMISGTKDDVVAGIPRVKGYLKALEDYGLSKKKENLVYREETISQKVGVHERCKKPVEFILTNQWFIDIRSSKEKILELNSILPWKR